MLWARVPRAAASRVARCCCRHRCRRVVPRRRRPAQMPRGSCALRVSAAPSVEPPPVQRRPHGPPALRRLVSAPLAFGPLAFGPLAFGPLAASTSVASGWASSSRAPYTNGTRLGPPDTIRQRNISGGIHQRPLHVGLTRGGAAYDRRRSHLPGAGQSTPPRMIYVRSNGKRPSR
jgi:hypothetical protein